MNGDLGAGRFTWLAGIEDTCIDPPAGSGMSSLDEYDLTGHTDAWRDDLEAARDLGATAVRYGVEWPRTNPADGEFDWTMLDERLAFAAGLGLTVVADLVHYGTPTWLDSSPSPTRGYSDAIASFAGRLRRARYRGVVDHLTPLQRADHHGVVCGAPGRVAAGAHRVARLDLGRAGYRRGRGRDRRSARSAARTPTP